MGTPLLLKTGTFAVAGPICPDTDADNFITAAGITDATQKTAICNLCTNLKAAGLWTKMKAIYPLVGGTASTHKFNLKNPADTNAAFRLSFVGGWGHSNNGISPNGVNTYANPFINTASVLTNNSSHVSFYSRTDIAQTSVDWGVQVPAVSELTLYTKWTDNNLYSDQYNSSTNRISYSNSSSTGFYISNRSSSTVFKVHKNGSVVGTNTNASSPSITNQNIIISALNSQSNPISLFSNRQCAFATIGDGLTDLEAQVFNQIVEGYQFSLGRNINPAQSFYYNPSYNNETNAFLYSTQVTDPVTQGAVNTLVNDMKTYGVWTKMKAVYPIVGGTATTHKFNLVDPRDSNAAFRLSFSGGWVHSSLGIQANGSNSFADTFLQANIHMPSSLNNFHLSVYSRTNINEGSIDIGAWTLTSLGQYSNLYLRNSDVFYTWINIDNNSAGSTGVTNTDSRGFFIGNRTASNVLNGFKDGVKILDKTNSSSILQQYPFYIGAVNNRGLGGYSYSNRQTSFYSIGDGLTNAEASNYRYAVEKFQTTLGRSVSTNFPTVSDTDAQSFINTANITDLTQANAVNNLVIGLKADGLWTKMKGIYPIVGGSASSHSINLKTQSQFNLSFVGGWTHSSTGMSGNGVNAYAVPSINPATQLSGYNAHLSVYVRNNTNTGFDIGASNSAYTQEIHLVANNGNQIISSLYDLDSANTNAFIRVGNSDSRGFTQNSVTSNTSHKVYKNGVVVGSRTGLNTTSPPSGDILIGALHVIGSTFTLFSNHEYAFVSLGEGLTDVESTNFYSRVQTFNTTLGRQV